jgi:hypothetical protein
MEAWPEKGIVQAVHPFPYAHHRYAPGRHIWEAEAGRTLLTRNGEEAEGIEKADGDDEVP